MDTRKRKFVVAFVLVIGLVIAATPRHVAASSSSTIYSFGTTQPIDGGVPKGSLTYVNVNGFLFGARLPRSRPRLGESNPVEESDSRAQANAAGLAARLLEIRSVTT